MRAEAQSNGLSPLIHAWLPLTLLTMVGWIDWTVESPHALSAELVLIVAAWALVALFAGTRAVAGLPLGLLRGAPWSAWGLAVFMGWVLAVTPFSRYPAGHWSHALTVTAVILATLCLTAWVQDAAQKRRAWSLAALGGLLLLECAVALVQRWGFPSSALVERGGLLQPFLRVIQGGDGAGTLGAGGSLGALVALLSPVVLGWCWASPRWGPRLLGVAVGLAGVGMLVLTGAHAALVGLGLAALACAALAWRQARTLAAPESPKQGPGVFAYVGVALALLVGAASSAPLLERLGGSPGDAVVQAERREVVQAATAMWAAAPLTGQGLGGWDVMGQDAIDALPPPDVSQMRAARFARLESEPLRLAAELGGVGALLGVGVLASWATGLWLHPSLAGPLRVGMLVGAGGLVGASVNGAPLHAPLVALAAAVVFACGAAGARGPALGSGPTMPLGGAARLVHLVLGVSLVGAVAFLAVSRGFWPTWQAAHWNHLALEVSKQGLRSPSIPVLYGLAIGQQGRAPGAHVLEYARALEHQGRLGDLVPASTQWPSGAFGHTGDYWLGRSFEESGRKAEAVAAYTRVVAACHPKRRSHRRAARRLKGLGASVPAAAAAPATGPTGDTPASGTHTR